MCSLIELSLIRQKIPIEISINSVPNDIYIYIYIYIYMYIMIYLQTMVCFCVLFINYSQKSKNGVGRDCAELG